MREGFVEVRRRGEKAVEGKEKVREGLVEGKEKVRGRCNHQGKVRGEVRRRFSHILFPVSL